MKKFYIGATFVFVVVLTSLVWHGCKKEEDLKGTIYGTVTDYATGSPVGNASVKLRPSGETTLTGSDGTYEFKDLDAGKYTLLLSKAEYADLDDDYIIEVENGKNAKRDVQMRKQIASLQITDMAGNSITSLDFGLEESVTSKSFNIFNDGTLKINCQMSYNCQWIHEVVPAGMEVTPGQTSTVTVIIDRTKLSAGENRTFLHIVSNNGSNELEITATGYGAPTVTTSSVSEITANSAKCGGNVTADGGSAVTDRGICWGTTNSPTLESGSHLSIGSGIGNFSGLMSNLSLNTVYYVRAYATNQRGTSYGEQQQFTTLDGLPTVMINDVTSIAATSAVCGGSVSNNGGFAVNEKGLVWSTTQYPTLNDSHISLGSGNASFTGTMTNLTVGTTYYVRTYATNSNGTSYSSAQKTFTTTSGLPSVTINNVTNITATSAVCGGSITDNGGFPVSDKGLVWSTSQYPTLLDNYISLGSGNAQFTGSMTNLSIGTTYYVRAYATNSQGTSYSSQNTFATGNGLPTVTTIAPSLNNTAVTTGGNVTGDGGYPVTARGVCYGTYPNPDLSSAYSHTEDGTGTGYYSSSFTITVGGGTYYIRAYATNANGTTYGAQYTIVHPYDSLPSFTYNGHVYKVAPDPGSSMDYSTANSYCQNLTYCGFDDWFMPNISQLTQMCVNKNIIGGFYMVAYWSTTLYNNYIICSYNNAKPYQIVNFQNCNVDYECPNFTCRVRPIRIDD